MLIRNPKTDTETSELAQKVFDSLTPHWKSLLPDIEVVVSVYPFNQVSELREFCVQQEDSPEWRQSNWPSTLAVCPNPDKKGPTVWVYYNKPVTQLHNYQFQRQLYSTLATILWKTSEKLRKKICQKIPGLENDAGLEHAVFVTFRDAFSLIFLNPEYLQKRKRSAWTLMRLLDTSLQ